MLEDTEIPTKAKLNPMCSRLFQTAAVSFQSKIVSGDFTKRHMIDGFRTRSIKEFTTKPTQLFLEVEPKSLNSRITKVSSLFTVTSNIEPKAAHNFSKRCFIPLMIYT